MRILIRALRCSFYFNSRISKYQLKVEVDKYMPSYVFPEGFLWGSSTSAFQVEGECKSHDFYDWALKGKIKDKSNPYDAVFHYRKYKEDIRLLKEMNHNAARIGIEWARIEPCEGIFDKEAICHYRDELSLLKSEGISTMVTLHHFSTPLWFAAKGGFEDAKNIVFFVNYVKYAVENLGDLIDFYITINEPTVLAYKGYFEGVFPPGKKSFLLMRKVNANLARAHLSAYVLIHSIHNSSSWKQAKVGIAKHMRTFDPLNPSSPLDKLSANYISNIINYEFLKEIAHYKYFQGNNVLLDFFGLNYYSGDLVKFPLTTSNRKELKKNSLGWDIYPQGLYILLKEVWKRYHLPIYVTENGTCDNDDELREDFIREHIKVIHKAISEKIDIKGYFHWSTLDNFELVEGLNIRFGLVHVDHLSPERTRTIKKSGRFYAGIAQNNCLNE